MKRREFYQAHGAEILAGAQLLQAAMVTASLESDSPLDDGRAYREECLDEAEEMVRAYLGRVVGREFDPVIP